MNIIWGEIKNLLHQKTIFFLIFAAFILNATLLYRQIDTTNEVGIGPIPINLIYTLLPAQPTEAILFLKSRLEQIKNDRTVGQLITGSMFQEEQLYSAVYEQVQNTVYYKDYIIALQEELSAKIRLKLFAQPGTFPYRNLVLCSQVYGQLLEKNIVPEIASSSGIATALEGHTSDLFLLFYAILFPLGLLTMQREQGLFFLLCPTKNGRSNLLAAKLAALGIFLAVAVLLIYGSNLLLSGMQLGIGNLLRPIQSIDGFLLCRFTLSVAQYILLFLATKFLWIMTVGSIMFLLCTAISMGLGACAGIGIVFALDLLRAQSRWDWLQMTSLIWCSNSSRYFSDYYNLNFFGYPVSTSLIAPLSMLVTIVLCCILSLAIFSHSTALSGRKKRATTVSTRFHSSLLWHESYKLLIQQWGLLLLLVAVFLQGIQFAKQTYAQNDYQHYYASVLSGAPSKEKKSFLAEEAAELSTLHDQFDLYTESFQAGRINQEAYRYFTDNLLIQLEREDAFFQAKAQYEHVEQMRTTIPKIQYVEQQVYDLVLGAGAYSSNQGSLFMLTALLVAGLSNLFVIEKSSHMDVLLCIMPRRRHVIGIKLCLAGIYAMFSTAIIVLPRFFSVALRLGYAGLEASCRSLLFLSSAWLQCSILTAMILTVLAWLFIALFISSVVLCCSRWASGRSNAMVAAVFCTLLPVAVWILMSSIRH